MLGARPVSSASWLSDSGFCSLITRSNARLSSDNTSASERMEVNQIFGSLGRG